MLLKLLMSLLIFLNLTVSLNSVDRIKMIRPFDDSIYPVEISGKYGVARTHAEGGHEYPHTGIDYKLAKNTSLRAAYSGTVIFAEDSETGYGNLIKIDHGGGIVTWYAHLSRPDVKEGQEVKQGEFIGKVGNSGRSYGPHVHFEVRINNKPVHPREFIF